MGMVIPRSASVERIFADFTTTIKVGLLSPDPAKSAVETWLTPLYDSVNGAIQDVEKAESTAADLEKILLVFDTSSDLEIGAVLDEMWNALGRPASSIDYTLIAGAGKSQWTDGDPRKQPTLMTILVARIRATTAPVLQANKEDWAKRIDTKNEPQKKAAADLVKAEAELDVMRGIARAVADLAQVALVRLKRDLKNAGFSEVQIHKVIPDYVPQPKSAA